jgi:histone H3/H4
MLWKLNSLLFYILDSRDGDEDDDGDRTGVLREQDRFLPIANVARLMKKSIPKSGKVHMYACQIPEKRRAWIDLFLLSTTHNQND